MNKPSSHFFSRLFRARWFYLVNILFIAIVGFSFVREIVRGHTIRTQIEVLEKQSESLQAQHLAIQELKNAVQTETFVEQEARLKLGLKKPGESVVILKNTDTPDAANGALRNTPAPAAGDTIGSEEKTLANSKKWWYYFFNKQLYRDAK